MASIKKFEDFEAWQMSRRLCREIDNITSSGTFVKDYALKDQIRRSSGSIMDNIAEGFGRGGNKEFNQFLSFSKGSAMEVQSQLYRALDYQHINQETFNQLYEETNHIIGKITNLMKYLFNCENKGTKYTKTKTPPRPLPPDPLKGEPKTRNPQNKP
jgi:four helix bundle protein